MYYDGVAAYKGQPQQFRGETGAQSSVLYAFDAALGVRHDWDAMRAYLLELRDYMPVQDRTCIAQLERGPDPSGTTSTSTASAPPHCARRITSPSRLWPSSVSSTSTTPPDTSSSPVEPTQQPRSEPAAPLSPFL